MAALLSPWILTPQTQAYEELILLLQDKRCPQCRLADVDLVHADLRGANFHGTDLRDAKLSGAQLDANALEQAHWSGATTLPAKAQSHAALHNTGLTSTSRRQAKLNAVS